MDTFVNKQIFSVSPELPPAAGGVADYAARLAAHWPGGALTSWYVAKGAEAARALRPDWSVQTVPSTATGSGWPDTGTLIVHYTQYGYAGNGIPWRLVCGLRKWRAGAMSLELGAMSYEPRKKAAPHAVWKSGTEGATSGQKPGAMSYELRAESEKRKADGSELTANSSQLTARNLSRRLVVFFHETWQEGPLWRRRGLIAPAARKCALELAAAADAVVTNCQKHAAQISRGGDVVVLPVPANVGRAAGGELRARSGELGALSFELGARRGDLGADGSELSANSSQLIARSTLRVVVFGLPETRLRALRAHRVFLTWLHARGGLGELVLLGGGDDAHRFAVEGALLAKEIAGAVVRRTGLLAEAEVSAELSRADLGLSAYAADEVGKSGTLAALFTHGCPVGCAGHDAGGLALDLSMTGDGPRDWDRFQDAGERAVREARVAIYAAKELGWAAHAVRLAELCQTAKNANGIKNV